jgi:hypothetical protein
MAQMTVTYLAVIASISMISEGRASVSSPSSKGSVANNCNEQEGVILIVDLYSN